MSAAILVVEASTAPLRVHRVVEAKEASDPFAPTDAGGRWSPPRRASVYASLSPAGAMLEYLAHREGQVVSRTDIWEQLYGQEDATTSNVVDVYIGYLRAKIDRDHPVKLIHTRRGLGYVLTANP